MILRGEQNKGLSLSEKYSVSSEAASSNSGPLVPKKAYSLAWTGVFENHNPAVGEALSNSKVALSTVEAMLASAGKWLCRTEAACRRKGRPCRRDRGHGKPSTAGTTWGDMGRQRFVRAPRLLPRRRCQAIIGRLNLSRSRVGVIVLQHRATWSLCSQGPLLSLIMYAQDNATLYRTERLPLSSAASASIALAPHSTSHLDCLALLTSSNMQLLTPSDH